MEVVMSETIMLWIFGGLILIIKVAMIFLYGQIRDLRIEQSGCKKDLWEAINSIRKENVTKEMYDDHKKNCPVRVIVDSRNETYTKFFSMLENGLKELNGAVNELRKDIARLTEAMQTKLNSHIAKSED